ncbi:hypothetical protein COCMIDRAFT_23510 [Bipolaris oryzae ATCC 44560]|uniref:Uncharacterized protein n=1 Tax=Bipolaris oryzae ATCC 44560 TaxID=930090 RepID=W6ZAH4_COCMI|nr:uncharacterized protein COCMIDRAFT_23510 [Bipolaris oryzae ATCC 44560]EUC48737.1 hypothetical protein COCMIDRAFT_23510 [Bipolaris oryzae ATCC 44560]
MSDYTVAMANSYSTLIDWLLALISISVCSILLFLIFLVVICFWIVIAMINFFTITLFMALLITISILVNIRGSEEPQGYHRIQDIYVADTPLLITTDMLPSASTSLTLNPKRSRNQSGKRQKR